MTAKYIELVKKSHRIFGEMYDSNNDEMEIGIKVVEKMTRSRGASYRTPPTLGALYHSI